MVNRQGASAGKPVPFEGTAEVTRKLPDQPIDHGAAFAALGKLFDGIGSEIGVMADRAAKREGTDAGSLEGKQAFDNLRPLALRRDGTIRGDAADHAATSAMEWRAMAAFHDGLRQAHEQAQGDPAVFDAAVVKLSSGMKVLAGNDPTLVDLFDRKMVAAAEPYRRSLSTQRSARIEEERRSAADEALAATGLDLARKAYLAGSDPGSSHALETDVAAARAAIDAAAEEGVISPAEALRRKRLLGDHVVEARLKGVFDALPDPASKVAWADGIEKRWATGDPALGSLDQTRVEGLMAHMRGAARADVADARLAGALDRRATEQALADDVASIRATGVATAGADERDGQRLVAMLGPVEAAKWEDRQREARAWFAQTSDLGRLTADELAARVSELDVAPGAPDYARKAKLRDDVAKEAERILKLRASDPASAVDGAVKGLRDLKAGLDPAKPETFERWVATRLSAQAAIGIPALAQQPLTDAEARAMMMPVTKAAPGKEWAAFHVVADDVAKRYGVHADAVARQLLEVHGIEKDTARAGLKLIEKLRRGEAARREAARVDLSRQTVAADKAMAPEPPPTATRPVPFRAIDRLRADPKLASSFDEKFGEGMAKLYLDEGASRTTIALDGTEGWTP